MKTYAQLNNLYNKVMMSIYLHCCLTRTVPIFNAFESVESILFGQNVFGKTQDCASAAPTIHTTMGKRSMDVKDIKRNTMVQFHIRKERFQRFLDHWKTLWNMLNAKRTILKKNVSFFILFCLVKHSFIHDCF